VAIGKIVSDNDLNIFKAIGFRAGLVVLEYDPHRLIHKFRMGKPETIDLAEGSPETL